MVQKCRAPQTLAWRSLELVQNLGQVISSLAIWSLSAAFSLGVAGLIARFWLVTPDVRGDRFFNRFPPFPIDPLHFTDNYFYFSLFLLFVSFCLFVYRSVKHRKAGPEPIEVAEEQTQHPFQRPLTLPVALTLALSLALLVFALETSRTTWTYAMFQMPSDDVTDAMRDDPTFILLDIESNPHAVRVVRFIPAREMISMFSELERGGYSNAGEAATKFEKERRERLMLSRMFWAGAVAFGLITAIMIWKGSRRRRSSAAGQERGDQPPS